MRSFALLAASIASLFAAGAQPPQSGVRPATPLIFDTDIGNDVDDCLALAMLHAFESRGEIRIAAVTITKDNPWAPRLASAIDRFYGRPGIPIGVVQNGKTKDDGYLRKALEAGHYRYDDNAEPAVNLLRHTLAAQADASVVIVQVGFSTNLAHLLDSPGGRDLVMRKVKRLVAMAGDFAGGGPEYNIKTDIPAAQKLTGEWPTPIFWSGFEVGRTIRYPARSIERDFGPPGTNPVADAYRNYMHMPYDRETWDLTAALYATRPDNGYFDLSEPGRVLVGADGRTSFRAEPGGRDRVLSVDDRQRGRILEAFLWLCSQPRPGPVPAPALSPKPTLTH
ncbi:MAG: nucleoside hydrolase [Bryobacteraceae bacterium]|jgi:inosine-uridine nucleoside N-ribohydrolase